MVEGSLRRFMRQIVPTVMFKMMADPDRTKAKRATEARC